MQEPITTVLLDVGGVLIDEGDLHRAYEERLRQLLAKQGVDAGVEDIAAARDAAVQRYAPSISGAVLWHFLQPDLARYEKARSALLAWFLEQGQCYYRVAPGALEVVAALAARYRVALAANQPSWAAEPLRRAGVLDLLDDGRMSEYLGFDKPDPRLFLAVLERVGARAEEAVMVGDRLDTDIGPAKRLGLRTIRVRTGIHAIQEARWPGDLPDTTVDRLADVPAAIERLAAG